jgi:acyl carrier protein
MTRNEIKKIVIKEVSSELKISSNKVKESSRFIEDLGADSLDLIEMIISLEEGLGITIEDEYIEKLTTVKSVIDFIVKQNPSLSQVSKYTAGIRRLRMSKPDVVKRIFKRKHPKIKVR